MLCNHPTWKGFIVEMLKCATKRFKWTTTHSKRKEQRINNTEKKAFRRHKRKPIWNWNDPKIFKRDEKKNIHTEKMTERKRAREIERNKWFKHLYHFVSSDKLLRLLIFLFVVDFFLMNAKRITLFGRVDSFHQILSNETNRLHIKSIYWIEHFRSSTYITHSSELTARMFAFCRT